MKEGPDEQWIFNRQTFQSIRIRVKILKTEYIGPGLDTISFTVFVSVSLGVNPREQMDLWVSKCRDGWADYFVIGGKPLGVDKWVIKSISESWDTIVKDGLLYSGKIQVSLEEQLE